MEANNEEIIPACSLTKTEMRERIESIEKFKKQIKERKEIKNGIEFQFDGSNIILNEIIELIKLERSCCSFLTFNLTIKKENDPIYLSVTGPEGSKDFLTHELGL